MTDLRRSTEDALSKLKDAFLQLDSLQREAKVMVSSYRTYLPERARTSSLVPRHLELDQKADARVAEYLSVLDQFPMVEKLRAPALAERHRAYKDLEPRLLAIQAEIHDFLSRYGAEFERVGAEVAKVDKHKAAASTALMRAHASWKQLRQQGFDSAEADRALAKARVAGRAVEAWTPQRGVKVLEDNADLVKQFAETVESVARGFPDRVRRAQNRSTSLRTRVEAISTRAESIPEVLRRLRREFSEGNWRDLEGQELHVAELIQNTAGSMARFEHAMAGHRWDESFVALEETEAALHAADEAVDAPGDRLRALREFKDDPKPEIDKVRFAIRDAQLLVMTGSVELRADYARELDGLVHRLDHLGHRLDGVHPNYWAALTELDRLQGAAKELVGRYRADPRRHAPST